jgi:hypothetical protein
MKADEKAVAEAVRIEHEQTTGKTFIVFEIKDEKFKRTILQTWTKDIEYRLIDKSLVENES